MAWDGGHSSAEPRAGPRSSTSRAWVRGKAALEEPHTRRVGAEPVPMIRVSDGDEAGGALADGADAELGDAVLGDDLVDRVLQRRHDVARRELRHDLRDRTALRRRVQDDEA